MTDHDNLRKKAESGLGAEAELTEMIQHTSAVTAPLAGVIRAEETAADERGTWKIEQGIDVLCRDGDKVGEVVEDHHHPLGPSGLVPRHARLDKEGEGAPPDAHLGLPLDDGRAPGPAHGGADSGIVMKLRATTNLARTISGPGSGEQEITGNRGNLGGSAVPRAEHRPCPTAR